MRRGFESLPSYQLNVEFRRSILNSHKGAASWVAGGSDGISVPVPGVPFVCQGVDDLALDTIGAVLRSTMAEMLKNFLGSRKAVFVALVVVAATVFVIIGKMSIEQWQEFVTWLGGVWVAAQGIEDAFVKSAKVKAPKGTDNA